MKKFFTAKNLTRGSLFFLLTWRFLISIATIRSGEIGMTYWEEVVFLCISYSVISVTLWVNKSDLNELNIDKNFVVLFIVLGVVYSFLTPSAFGILLGVATILNFGVFFSSKSRFAKNELGTKNFFIFLAILLVLDFIYFIVVQKAKLLMSDTAIIEAVFWTNLPLIVAEEFLFRGLLWKFLRDFDLSENKIIYIQAFLFWLCHFYLTPIVFWIFLPLISILLGCLTSRAKSITPGIFLHFLHNFFSFILRY
jgi:membrane protease YdiL (CAAX protease family)